MDSVVPVVAVATVMVLLVALANRSRIAYPIVLVLAGLALGFVPGVPAFALDPHLVLVIFLPPLLYWASITAPTGEFRRALTWIAPLAVGLVILTMVVVAAVAHLAIPGMGWTTALVLGAIVASTDDVAFGEIARDLRMPRRTAAIVEGEALINDATSLVLYAAAVGAVVEGSFQFGRAAGLLVVSALGAIAIGFAVGWLLLQVWRRTDDPMTQNLVSLLAPYLSYLPAQWLGISAVLSVVTTGLYVSRYTPLMLTPLARQRSNGIRSVMMFALNGCIFVLVGMQFRPILGQLSRFSLAALIGYGILISLAVILTRVVWVLVQTLSPSRSPVPLRDRASHAAIVSWSGMRGGVSLAAALAIPLATKHGPFPDRELITFLTFCVLLATLVGQGLTLPLLVRWLHVEGDRIDVEEQQLAIAETSRAALDKLHELAGARALPAQLVNMLENRYLQRWQAYAARAGADGPSPEHLRVCRVVESQILQAERDCLMELRLHGKIDNTTMRRIETIFDDESIDLDLLNPPTP